MSFLRPKIKTPEPPPPPTVEDGDAARQDYADAMRKRRGRAASVLTQAGGPAPQTAAKTLLGG